ncbi:hypothetical protein F4775DRAFT_69222 [Biscogniauxia sp. FL1348]|nr:hypothetical protein F4775DRAFT_69222 [Biscogniauxia sp. FL1348]
MYQSSWLVYNFLTQQGGREEAKKQIGGPTYKRQLFFHQPKNNPNPPTFPHLHVVLFPPSPQTANTGPLLGSQRGILVVCVVHVQGTGYRSLARSESHRPVWAGLWPCFLAAWIVAVLYTTYLPIHGRGNSFFFRPLFTLHVAITENQDTDAA